MSELLTNQVLPVVINQGGKLLVSSSNVAIALEYSEASNASRLFDSIPTEWKGVKPIHTLADIAACLEIQNASDIAKQVCEEFGTPRFNLGVIERATGPIEVNFVTEPQLYFVMMRSRSEHAREFRQWVCNEVLPSIRKTGAIEEI